jgi:hypothetical protein
MVRVSSNAMPVAGMSGTVEPGPGTSCWFMPPADHARHGSTTAELSTESGAMPDRPRPKH